MRPWIIGFIMLAPLLTGCESHDRAAATDFTPPDASGKFRYRAYADVVMPLASSEAEQKRMRMLEEWLRLNGYCARGYDISDRRAVKRAQAVLADIYDVWYAGRCKA